MDYRVFLVLFMFLASAEAQEAPKSAYPIKYFAIQIEHQNLRMAYRDVQPRAGENGRTVLLLHGKNFSGYYWERVIQLLESRGFRVLAPDQIGFGASSRPNIHYSFHQMAVSTKLLLDSLGIARVVVVGHSMGGMLAARFALMYPAVVEELVLEDSIGLEDYRTFVPYASVDDLYKDELNATYESMLRYQKTYYVTWKTDYEQYVRDQAWVLKVGEYPRYALASALTSEMAYEQPVCYELSNIKVATLLIIGQEDHMVPGKTRLSPEIKAIAGNYPKLGENAHQLIRDSKLVIVSGAGHIPHVERPEEFDRALLAFLAQ